MAMKKLVITLPEEAVGHVLNGLAGPHGYRPRISGEDGGEIDNPVTLEDFALGIHRDYLLGVAREFNIADQKRQADAEIIARAEAEAASLLPYVTSRIEDAE